MLYQKQWVAIYLKDALARLQPLLKGYDLTLEDVYVLQQMCAYEVRWNSMLDLKWHTDDAADRRARILQVL